MAALISDVLNFWFEEIEPKQWYVKDAAFDEAVRVRFGDAVEQAGHGELDFWKDSAIGCLALCILLDQFTRNIYRGTPKAFAFDEKAREVARHAYNTGLDMDEAITPQMRTFLYLPFEHHENIGDQDLCVKLAKERVGLEGFIDYAEKHRVIIERFGRFPHRNAILGRESTAEEAEFLAQPGSGF